MSSKKDGLSQLWIEAPCGNIGELMDRNDYGYEIDMSIHSISPVLYNTIVKIKFEVSVYDSAYHTS